MKDQIWICTIGETLPILDRNNSRLLRSGIMAKTCVDLGFEVTYWSSNFEHRCKRFVGEGKLSFNCKYGYKIELIKTVAYERNFSLKRIYHNLIIGIRFLLKSRNHKKPRLIIASYPSPELCLAALIYAKLNKIPFIMDFRDLWPETFYYMVNEKFRNVIPFFSKPYLVLRNYVVKRADCVCGITLPFLKLGTKNIKQLNDQKLVNLPFPYETGELTLSNLKTAFLFWKKLGIQRKKKFIVLLYLGSLGVVPDLNTVIDAVISMNRNGDRIKLLICGDGDHANSYKNLASSDPNIIFTGYIDQNKISAAMYLSDFGINPLPDRLDFRVGVNNKAVEYLSSGLPIIHSPPTSYLGDLIKKGNCGTTYQPGNIQSFIQSVENLKKARISGIKLKENAKDIFAQNYSKQHFTRKLKNLLNKCL